MSVSADLSGLARIERDRADILEEAEIGRAHV